MAVGKHGDYTFKIDTKSRGRIKMTYIIIFFSELIILFFLSRFVTSGISQLVFNITGSHRMAVYTMSILFLPGTIIHELSHYLTAQLLFVRTGDMEFVPNIYDDRVKLGSVQIEKTDPIRRAIIGFAPFIVGTSLLILILFAAEIYNAWESIWLTILIFYLLFEIGNTMFSSSKDMEGFLELFAVVLIFGIILYLTGLRIPESFFSYLFSDDIVNVFQKGSYYLLLPLSIDVIFLIFKEIAVKIFRIR